MSLRFIITGAVAAILLAGLAWFNFMFKPNMIKTIMSSQVPPPATVTAETARTEKWVEQLTSIGTLIASQGVDIDLARSPASSPRSTWRAARRRSGAPAWSSSTSRSSSPTSPAAKATLQEAEVAYQRQADLIAKRVTSEANLDTARAKRDTALAAVKKIEAVIAQKTIMAPFSGRLGIRKVERGQYVSPGMVLVTLQALDPIRVDFPMPEQLIGKLRVGQEHRGHRRCVSRRGLQGRDRVARCARGAGHAHAAGARQPAQPGSASCCPACSPTSWCWRASRARS